MAKVGIVMGSDSDMPIMAQAADFLDKMGIDYEMTIISAHREPDIFLTMQNPLRRKALRLSLQVLVRQRICRVCARHCFRCR